MAVDVTAWPASCAVAGVEAPVSTAAGEGKGRGRRGTHKLLEFGLLSRPRVDDGGRHVQVARQERRPRCAGRAAQAVAEDEDVGRRKDARGRRRQVRLWRRVAQAAQGRQEGAERARFSLCRTGSNGRASTKTADAHGRDLERLAVDRQVGAILEVVVLAAEVARAVGRPVLLGAVVALVEVRRARRVRVEQLLRERAAAEDRGKVEVVGEGRAGKERLPDDVERDACAGDR